MSLEQLHCFVAVAEEQNVVRASRRLHRAQPPVSRAIAALEDELGAKLFVRRPRGMQLLPAGERFLQHARDILRAVEAARDDIRSSSEFGAPKVGDAAATNAGTGGSPGTEHP
jgi:DNA-binding transcriptional LysR family regulator